MIHTIFFDVGGTLVDSENIFEVLARRLDRGNEKAIAAFLHAAFMEIYRGDSGFLEVKEILALVIKKASEKFGVADLSAEAGRMYRETFVDNARLFPDTLWTLGELKKRGIGLIVLSDADAEVLRDEMGLLEISDYFDDFIISSELRAYKPSDRVVEAALEFCEEPYSGILVVGDSQVDVLTAKKMNVRSVLISRKGASSHEADFVIRELKELLDIII